MDGEGEAPPSAPQTDFFRPCVGLPHVWTTRGFKVVLKSSGIVLKLQGLVSDSEAFLFKVLLSSCLNLKLDGLRVFDQDLTTQLTLIIQF